MGVRIVVVGRGIGSIRLAFGGDRGFCPAPHPAAAADTAVSPYPVL